MKELIWHASTHQNSAVVKACYDIVFLTPPRNHG